MMEYKGLVKLLGITEVERGDGTLVMKMPITDNVKQPFGYVHGGANVVLSETVASLGAIYTINLDTHIAFGLEINANHIKAKREGTLFAYGKALHKGNTTQVWQVDIYDENDSLVCASRCTVAIKEKRSNDN